MAITHHPVVNIITKEMTRHPIKQARNLMKGLGFPECVDSDAIVDISTNFGPQIYSDVSDKEH